MDRYISEYVRQLEHGFDIFAIDFNIQIPFRESMVQSMVEKKKCSTKTIV